MQPNVFRALAVVAVLLLFATPVFGSDLEPTDRFLIEGAGGALPADLASIVEDCGGTLLRTHPEINLALVQSTNPDFVAEIEGFSEIGRCTQDMVAQWTPSADDFELTQQDDDADSGGSGGSSGGGDSDSDSDSDVDCGPTGAFFQPCQFDLDLINVQGAWSQGQCSDSTVKVAVLDGGVDPFHQDLAGKIDTANSTSVLSAPTICDLFAPDQTTFFDFNFHGTFVAGQIATNNIGVVGVAPESQIVGVKVLSCLGNGTFGDVIAGIMYAATVPGVEVMNLSLGATLDITIPAQAALAAAVDAAVDFAVGQGVAVVASAGNDATNFDANPNLVHTPSMSPNAISISSTTIDDQLASYSNFGLTGAWVGAPGGSLPNPAAPLPGCVINPAIQSLQLSVCSSLSITLPFTCGTNSYVLASGTSFASPLAAGVVALADNEARDDDDSDSDSDSDSDDMSPADHKVNLADTADDLGAPGDDPIFSRGRINAGEAVDEAEAGIADDDSDSD